jgi:23S rRNA (uracil1939-C5)-methyltransferase
VIDHLGQQGDGVADWQGEKLYVPFSLTGERVSVAVGMRHSDGYRGRLTAVLETSTNRITPACRHFGSCGGCTLQHLGMSAYRQWKIDSVLTTLAQRGIEIQVEPKTVFVQAGTRRRAVFAVTGDGKIGFHRAASHDVIDLQQCDILTPALFAFLQALRRIVGKVLHANEAWDVLATDCENGIDVLITAKASPRNAHRFALADLAQIQLDAGGGKTTDIARISWLVDKRGAQPEPIAQQRLPQVRLGEVAVDLPHQSFLQPSLAGEQALQQTVVAGVGAASLVADLYAGCGTFSFPLGKRGKVIAVEGAKSAVAALNHAARRALVSDRVTATVQDLDDAPLMPEQLKKFQAVVFDPPRAGARSQAEQLAKSIVPVAVAVSCNPATFARDARLLVDGGYRLTDLTIVDQFIWSAHVELVARFER